MKFKKAAIKTTFFIVFCVFLVGCDSDASVQTKTFADLPKSEQDLYIKKDEIGIYSEHFSDIDYAKNLDIEDNETSTSIDELKAQIRLLKEKNRLLFEDNAQFANANRAMITKLKELKDNFDNEKELINSKNLEIMNDVEKQHYKNINDLTKKLNEVQKENLIAIKTYEQKILTLENTLDDYQKKLQQSNLKFDEKVATSLKEQNLKNSELVQKNNYLLEQVESLKKSMASSIDTLTKQVEEKKLLENELKKELLQKDTKINELLASHTNEIIELQKKNSQDLKELKNEILTQKKEYFDELNLKSSEFLNLSNEYENYKKNKQDELIALQQNLTKKYKNATEKTINDIKNDLLKVIVEQNSTITLLNAKISNMQNKLKNDLETKDNAYAKSLQILKDKAMFMEENENKLKKELNQNRDDFKLELDKKDIKISELNAQIQDLIKRQTDSKMIKNYEILNENITDLKVENENLKKIAIENLQKANDLVLQKDREFKIELARVKEHYESIIKDLEIDDFDLNSTSSLEGKKSVASIKCDIAKDGILTKECQDRIDILLKKHGESATYEISPVASEFKYVDSNQSAILSSIHLRSARNAMSLASKPLKSKFGSKLKIVYNEEIKFEKSGYGFLIRVYK